MKQIDMKRGWV